jgi:sugar lactone lactonase YvrE
MSTVAGNGGSRYLGDGSPALLAQLNQPYGIAVDSAGNVYFSEYGNSRVRKITPDGGITTVAGNGTYGSSGDGGQATKAQLASPAGLALDTAGNLYIADADSSCVRRVSSDGVIVTVAGNGTYGSSGDGGQATNASLRTPYGVTVDASGNLYIADALANRVRRVTPDGIIATIAGNGALGFTGDGNQATKARLRLPFAVAVDASGTLYIADTGNNRIRQVISNGVITTIAGNGIAGYGGDGGLAKNAQVVGPTALAADANGNLYIGGISANRLRQIAGGSISTIGGAGVLGYSGDGGDALAAQVNGLGGVAVDAGGNIYLADTGNDAVRVMRVTPTAKPAQ